MSIKKNSIAKLICDLTCARIILALFFGAIYFLALITSNKLTYFSSIFVFMIFAESINPYWYFQNKQKLHFFSIPLIANKFLYLLLIILFVKSDSDLIKIPILYSVCIFLAYAFSFFVMCRSETIKKLVFNLKTAFSLINSTKQLFYSKLVLIIKDRFSTIILGIYSDMSILAIFDMVQKITILTFQPLVILNNSFFPALSKKFNSLVIKKIAVISFLYGLLSITIGFLALKITIPLIISEFQAHFNILKISLYSIFAFPFSFLIAKNIFITHKLYKLLTISSILTTLFYITTLLFLVQSSQITLYNIVLLNVVTYFIELLIRTSICLKHRSLRTIIIDNT